MAKEFEPVQKSDAPDTAVAGIEAVACNACGSRDEIELFTGGDRLLGLPGTFRCVACARCGLLRQNPRPTPDAMQAYYPANYQPYAVSPRAERHWWRRVDRSYGQSKRRRLIERFVRSGRLLDVGAATGNFLEEMVQTGRWTVVGLEPNPAAAAYAAKATGTQIHVTTLTGANLADGSFDVITLWNVLEHLHHPVDDLKVAARLLKPGGVLVLSIPNLDSFETRLFGARWIGWDLPRHLYFFSCDVLEKLLATLSLTVEDACCLSGSHLSFALSLECLYSADEPRPLWHRLVTPLFTSLPMRLFLTPVFYVVGWRRQATIITIVARKH